MRKIKIGVGGFEAYINTDRFDQLKLDNQDIIQSRVMTLPFVIESSTMGGWVKVKFDDPKELPAMVEAIKRCLEQPIARGEGSHRSEFVAMDGHFNAYVRHIPGEYKGGRMTYDELLATIPDQPDDFGDSDKEGNELYEVCPVCAENGFCRTRADFLTADVMCELSELGVFPDELSVLQWLLDTDAIGMMRDEDAEELAKQYSGLDNDEGLEEDDDGPE